LGLLAATKVEPTSKLLVEIRCDKQREVVYMTEASKFGENLPEKKFRAGAISATIWRNTITKKDGTPAEIRTVSFQRSYKDKETDEWKNTSSLRSSDLPRAVVVLNKAYEYLVLSGQGDLAVEVMS
jgi:hypothetical protein